MKTFHEWVGNRGSVGSVLVGTKSGGTEGANASLYAAILDDKGEYKQARDPRLGTSTTFLHPGTWIRTIRFMGVGPKGEKVYRLEASEDNGATWGDYEVYDEPILKEHDPLP
jgi:hypothetical protein